MDARSDIGGSPAKKEVRGEDNIMGAGRTRGEETQKHKTQNATTTWAAALLLCLEELLGVHWRVKG